MAETDTDADSPVSSGFEGVYRSGDSPKRHAEVLERLRAGKSEKQIAADLGIAPHSVAEITEHLRSEGRLPRGSSKV